MVFSNYPPPANHYYVGDTIYSNEKTGLGIFTYDQSNDAYNKNGVNAIKLFLDSNLIYHFELDKLDFSKNKYINAHIDYEEKVLSKRKFHKCYRLPHNPLKNYKTILNSGYINLDDNKVYNIKFEVFDSYKNKSELSTIVAEILAKKANEKNIKKIYFDRGIYKYHGRVKIFAETLRKNGMEF